jgi:DNA-binding FadR family transcriptional regulator
MALADASHNGVMVHLNRWMRALAEIWMEVWEDDELDRGPAIRQIIREHEEILEGVLARDPERAAGAMYGHLTNAAERVLAVLGRDRSSAEYIAHLLARSA